MLDALVGNWHDRVRRNGRSERYKQDEQIQAGVADFAQVCDAAVLVEQVYLSVG
jgi:hypothetical protein